MNASARLIHARAWDAADIEPLANATAPIHDALVARLAPRPGERWLDVATGTGPVALRAAAAGADVTALDLSPRMLFVARRRAREQGLSIRLVAGDAECLPFPAASFDVTCSAQGVMFALDQEATCRELARVTAPGGRLGLSVLRAVAENAALFDLVARFLPAARDEARPLDWGRREHVESLLGQAFALQFEEGDAPLVGRTALDLWALQVRACGPVRFLAQSLPPRRREALRDAFVGYYERYRTADGVCAPRPYLLVLGRRR